VTVGDVVSAGVGVEVGVDPGVGVGVAVDPVPGPDPLTPVALRLGATRRLEATVVVFGDCAVSDTTVLLGAWMNVTSTVASGW
jgi:hypothetical protein